MQKRTKGLIQILGVKEYIKFMDLCITLRDKGYNPATVLRNYLEDREAMIREGQEAMISC